MDEIYLIDGHTYTFNLYNNYFANREIVLEDVNGSEITSGVTNTWEFQSGKPYDGVIERSDDGNVYAEGTEKIIQKTKIEFTPDRDNNVPSPYDVYMVGKTGTDLRKKMHVYSIEGALLNPDQEKFIVLFRHLYDYNSDQNLVDSYTSSMTPAGLIIGEEKYADSPGFLFSQGDELDFVDGTGFDFVLG